MSLEMCGSISQLSGLNVPLHCTQAERVPQSFVSGGSAGQPHAEPSTCHPTPLQARGELAPILQSTPQPNPNSAGGKPLLTFSRPLSEGPRHIGQRLTYSQTELLCWENISSAGNAVSQELNDVDILFAVTCRGQTKLRNPRI